MRPQLFFLILLLVSSSFPNVKASSEYGEDSASLGQFVEDYENDDNVSVAVNVINNQTLECMELNYTIGDEPTYQNFTEYTEVDSAADITVIERVVTWSTMRRDAASWVVYDFGVDYFGDFTVDFTLDFSDIDAGDISARHILEIIAFSNTIGSFADTVGGDLLNILPRQVGQTDDWYRYDFFQQTGGVMDFLISDTTNYNMPKHYGTLERSGTNLTLRIYTDEDRTILVEKLTSIGNVQKYRYFHVMASYDSAGDGADHSSGTVSDVSFEKAGGYDEGYFNTTDYLDYVNGSSLVWLTNASIPGGTTLKVQFSDDAGSTWVDNQGDPGSNSLIGGFEALDLRDLNYTSLTVRYNFTGIPTDTPRLYQSRLITTEDGGAPGPGVTVIESDAPWIALAIILSIIAFLLATKVKR